MPLLQADKVSKSFYLNGLPKLILSGASFSLEEGEFACVVGPSGCGKSTFLELLAGITLPDAGSIWRGEEEITGKSGYLGYMPQDDLLLPWLSAEENALLPARIRGTRTEIEQARKRVRELLPVFGLAEHAGHLPYQLSGGLRQRVAFLRTCMTGSPVLLLDEPFASLDAITRIQLQDWLKDITSELKLSIILVTHDIQEAICLGNRVWVMSSNPGRFSAQLEIREEDKADYAARLRRVREIVDLVRSEEGSAQIT